MSTLPSSGKPRFRVFQLIAGFIVVAGAGVLAYALVPSSTRVVDASLPATGTPEFEALLKQGRAVSVAGDCIACHTAPGGTPFAGGLPIASPIGTIYSTNITPDKNTGIGNYSLNDFDRAVRHGIIPSGDTLYPAMPYPSYAKLTDEDTRALYAFFMGGVAAANQTNQANGIAWPMSMRWPLAIWRKTFAPSSPMAPVGVDVARYGDMTVARGAYLAQAAGHCGSCHTPRAATLQERALDDSSPLFLAGGQVIDHWYASNLRSNEGDGLARWSVNDIVDMLKTGRNTHSAVLGGPMSDVVSHSTQHMPDEDLHAIATYLKTLSPAPIDKARFVPNAETATQLQAGKEPSRGAQIYVDNCAACHRTDGKGYDNAFPSIAGNPTVLANESNSLIHLVLAGAQLPSTALRPSNLGMPGFADRLSDEEVAQLITFVRQSWGNQATGVTAAQVPPVRKMLEQAQHTRQPAKMAAAEQPHAAK